ncbi:MAG: MFS transporter [Anaerolineales bacterium]
MSLPLSNENFIQRNLRYNFTVNMLDGGFFGFALGFASFITIIPLFVSQMTDSAMLIGLIPAIHSTGWQLPQLLTADQVSRAKRYKPLALLMTLHERLPFLGLAIIAWFLPHLETQTALILTYALLIWQGLGGGFTANAWTNMISKIIPAELHGTFFGAQTAAFTGFEAVAAILAGLILDRLDGPLDFTLCFLAAVLAMIISYFFIALTREPDSIKPVTEALPADFWKKSGNILRSNRNFSVFLAIRSLSQFAVMGFSFYTIYAVWHFGINDFIAGVMTTVFLLANILASLLMGRWADRWSPRKVMAIGALGSALSALMAWLAPSAAWFYPALVFASLGAVATWTIPMALTIRFGSENELPFYIGLSNTTAAPASIMAPIVGGWLADAFGFQATFIASALCGLLTASVLYFALQDPVHAQTAIPQPVIQPPIE